MHPCLFSIRRTGTKSTGQPFQKGLTSGSLHTHTQDFFNVLFTQSQSNKKRMGILELFHTFSHPNPKQLRGDRYARTFSNPSFTQSQSNMRMGIHKLFPTRYPLKANAITLV